MMYVTNCRALMIIVDGFDLESKFGSKRAEEICCKRSVAMPASWYPEKNDGMRSYSSPTSGFSGQRIRGIWMGWELPKLGGLGLGALDILDTFVQHSVPSVPSGNPSGAEAWSSGVFLACGHDMA